jgi:O-antigen ligase
VYSIYYKKSAIKEMTVLIAIILVGAGIAFVVSPKMLSGVEDRASSTFDASQDTYQGRFNNIFTVLDLSKENPLFGKPLVTNESVQMKAMKVTRGNTTTSVMQLVVTPHNLALEWLLYYGWLGVMLGLSLLIAMTRFVKRFLRDHKNNAKCYQAGVIMLCALSHNLFYAFSNVTTNDLFATYFLYFPLVILIAISRNEESYCN